MRKWFIFPVRTKSGCGIALLPTAAACADGDCRWKGVTLDMGRVFSNGPSKDFVINPFTDMVSGATRIYIAAPYVTKTDDLLQAARSGKRVDLLVGLNATTSPCALSALHLEPNVAIRYFTHRFHAKVYLFDRSALVGSSNLTDGGLRSNREATILFNEQNDSATIEELRALFAELWEYAAVLTTERLKTFAEAYERFKGQDQDGLIGAAVGITEPPNINVASRRRTSERIFLEGLRRQVSDYRKSFNEVTKVLEDHQIRRAELEGLGAASQTNRYLNWVRRTQAPGDAWESAPIRSQDDRRTEILRLGHEWVIPDQDVISDIYIAGVRLLKSNFGTAAAIDASSKEELTAGLMSVHAFSEQLRFVKGGEPNLPLTFWSENSGDVRKVQRTLGYLAHGGGDFVERLHDVLYGPAMKLKLFGISCALELYGTIRPEDCPPVNGRIAKALRYLGFNVSGM